VLPDAISQTRTLGTLREHLFIRLAAWPISANSRFETSSAAYLNSECPFNLSVLSNRSTPVLMSGSRAEVDFQNQVTELTVCAE
jgi:hypothetical protein